MANSNSYILVREVERHLENNHVIYELSIIDSADIIGALVTKINDDAVSNGFELDTLSKDSVHAKYRAFYVNNIGCDITYSIYELAELKRNGVVIGQFFGCKD